METELYYTKASHLLEEGQTKDAYAAFLSIVELSIQQLHRVKFVHQTVVSKPTHYEDSITFLRSSIDQLEKIAVHPSPSLPGAIKPNSVTKSPPPLPPKPATIQKPAVPPKPRIIPIIDTTVTKTITNTTINASITVDKTYHPYAISPEQTQLKSKRGRGSSVSFADPPTTITTTIQAESDEIQEEEVNSSCNDNVRDDPDNVVDEDDDEDDDDDDDDDVLIDFDNVKPAGITRAFTFAGSSENSSIIQPPIIPPRARSKSWMVPGDSVEKSVMDVLSETVVNPWNLVPAQTNTGDSLAIPNSSHATDYVPNIPAPPLLATHRKLQHRLNELETALEQNKDKKKQRNALNNNIHHGTHQQFQHPHQQQQQQLQQQHELDFLISEQTHSAASLRDVLNKVRTLYMSAMTIPSILQFPPHLIAYQLSLIESLIFRDIPVDALLTHSARTPHKKIAASTDFFNFITRSIEHSILLPQEPTKRAEIVNRWIKIGTKLLALNNYQTLKAIVSALGTPPIQRLRRTWECIPKKRIGRLELLTTLMSETDNYRRYREHMCFERKRLWSNPVVPFLGVFIHDITYLYAAAKGNKDDSRVQDVLTHMRLLQRAPGYPQRPPTSYLDNNKKKQHLFRSKTITNALHFGNSSKNNNNNRFNTAGLMGEDRQEETELELEQQLIIQYFLMRPWVSEKTIDALSSLREPSKPRSVSSPTSSIYGRPSTISSPNSLTITTGVNLYNGVNNSGNNMNSNSSSLLGNASSFMRFSNGNSNNNSGISLENDNGSLSPSSASTPVNGEENKRSLGGFWPFRKSSEMNRSSVNTDNSTTPPGPSWSEEDEDDDDDESPSPPSSSTNNTNSSLMTRRTQKQYIDIGTRKRVFGHNRSTSLPSAKSFGITDLYPK
ncbi:ras GEF [Backusella circina FSU 941]|nr:ras GEF [Backusella circina FSU 941]